MALTSIDRRQVLCAALLTLLAGDAMAGPAQANDLRIVSPFPAGGSVDYWARVLQQGLTANHGFNVQALNMPGGSGMVAMNQIQNAGEESPTSLLIASVSIFSLLPLLPDSGMKFNPNDVYIPLAVLWVEPFFIAVRSDSPFQNFDDFVTRASSQQRRLSYGTAGAQTTGEIYFDNFVRKRRLPLVSVPFKGMTEVVSNLLGGHIDIGLLSYQQAKPHLVSKSIRLLASTGQTRSPMEPNLPTMLELKYSDFACSVWFGLFAKKTTDSGVLGRIQTAFKALLGDPILRAKMTELGFEYVGLTGAEAAHYVRQSNETWTKIFSRISGP